MARYNEILSGRFNRAAQKVFSMKGPASLVTLSDELRAVIPFFWGAENRYLESWQRFGVFVDQVGAAAQLAQIRIHNPAGSNVVAVMEKILFENPTAAANDMIFSVAPGLPDLGTIVSTTNRRFDPRGQTAPTCVVSSTNNGVAVSSTVSSCRVAANSNFDLLITDIQELPILPGDAYSITSLNVNAEIMVSLWWRERFLEDSERT